MPELRKDPIIGRWVIISTERGKRPSDFQKREADVQEAECPFCEGNEEMTPPELYALRSEGSPRNGKGWDVRVVSSLKPLLSAEGDLCRRGQGIYDVMDGIGAHEIVIETPGHMGHIADLEEIQIAKVISTYIHRIKVLEKDVRLKYVLLFKNHGVMAGASKIFRHCRSQLIATPVTPKRVKEKLNGARRYFEFRERCIFCDMIKQEFSSGERIVVDMDDFVGFTPFASRFPFETWIVPKLHCPDFHRMQDFDIANLAKTLKEVLSKLKAELNDPPFNLILHTAPFRRVKNSRRGYWDTIEHDFHWHIEIMPRLTHVAGFEWGSGFYINTVPPEDAAKYLRGEG